MLHKITLTKSKQECTYDSEKDAVFSIADRIADELGIDIKIGCRNGYCKTCLCSITKGDVAYFNGERDDLSAGTILPCCSSPISDIEVDL